MTDFEVLHDSANTRYAAAIRDSTFAALGVIAECALDLDGNARYIECGYIECEWSDRSYLIPLGLLNSDHEVLEDEDELDFINELNGDSIFSEFEERTEFLWSPAGTTKNGAVWLLDVEKMLEMANAHYFGQR